LSILAGLVRPDEASTGTINHAIRLTLPKSDIDPQFIYPASHEVSTSTSNMLPMGGRLRLMNTPAVNAIISQMGPESQAVAHAMQQYGLILADVGSAMYITGDSDMVNANNMQNLVWDMNDISGNTFSKDLASLTASDFQVVNLTPVVSGLSETSGAAGSVLTITGLNFSGSAGHLQVLFVPPGNNPPYTTTGTAGNLMTSLNPGVGVGTSLQIVDDSHIRVIVPSGLTGTVDVEILSGQLLDDNYNSNAENATAPIFGNGLSPTSSSDKFTFVAGTPPATPTGLAAAAGQNQIGLTWNAVSGATSYNVYRSTAPGGEGVIPFKTGLTTSSYTDPGLVTGVTYYYMVSAVGATGEGDASSEASAVAAGTFSDQLNVNNSNGLDANWNVFFGQFSITGGHALGTAQTYPHGNLAEANLPAPLNNLVNVSASIQFNLAATPTTANGRYAGVLARIQDPSDFYAAFVYYNSTTNLNLIGVGYQLPGPFNSFVSTVQIPVSATSGTLRFDLFGNSLKVYLNGILEISTTDSRFATGGVGFGDAYEGGGQFTNFVVSSLAAPALPFSDSFHRSTSSTLGEPWTGTLVNGGFAINGSNQATSLGSGTNVGALFGVNLTTSTNVSAAVVNAGSGAGVVADWNSTTNSGYALLLSGSMLQLYKATSGTLTALGTARAAGAATGNVQLVAASGVLSVYFNGSLLFTVNDTTFTSGSAGLIAKGLNVAFSSFTLSGS
jgi:hypothetical protein